jgi:capsid protein
MGRFPFDAAGRGRRGIGRNPLFLGLNTLLFSHGLELQSRNRDAVRNSAWAAAAVDSYVANPIGRGIRLVPHHPDENVRDLITRKWNRWTRECDVEYDPRNPASGQTDFYGQQIMIAREVMEAGECFVRFRPRSRIPASTATCRGTGPSGSGCEPGPRRVPSMDTAHTGSPGRDCD